MPLGMTVQERMHGELVPGRSRGMVERFGSTNTRPLGQGRACGRMVPLELGGQDEPFDITTPQGCGVAAAATSGKKRPYRVNRVWDPYMAEIP